MKILRVILYIAAGASFYSLSHAVNVRYCVKNVGNSPMGFSITSTMNQLKRTAGVYILPANPINSETTTNPVNVKTLEERLLNAQTDALLDLEVFDAQEQTVDGKIAEPHVAGFMPSQALSYFFKPLTAQEINDANKKTKNYIFACHINKDADNSAHRVICKKTMVAAYTNNSCNEALADLQATVTPPTQPAPDA